MKKIIITGGSGFLGSAITKELLSREGYEVVVMDIREPRLEHERLSFVKANLLDTFAEDFDNQLLKHPHAVIHLSGKGIFGRFTKKHKQLVYDTRVTGTYKLIDLLKREDYKPKKLISASAVGYYGDQPQTVLTESSERENYDFLSHVVVDWEQASLSAQEYGISVSCVRNAHIIGNGGIAAVVAGYIRFGIASILGSGHTHMPWIDIRDLLRLYIDLVDNPEAPLIINGSNGTHETQESFARAIGHVKNARWYIHVYQWMLWLRFGSFAQEMLADQQVQSEHFRSISFTPKHLDLQDSINEHLN